MKHLHNLATFELNLAHNSSLNELGTLFKSLTQLQKLKILRISWEVRWKTDLTKLLVGLENLQKLFMSYNNLGDEDMPSFVEALKTMNHLHTLLHLSYNKIGDNGIILLAEVMESHLPNLEVLALYGNDFTNII